MAGMGMSVGAEVSVFGFCSIASVLFVSLWFRSKLPAWLGSRVIPHRENPENAGFDFTVFPHWIWRSEGEVWTPLLSRI